VCYDAVTGREVVNTRGYAGTGAGRNNPMLESVRDVGPLPGGEYAIGPAYNSRRTGQMTLPLTPSEDNEMFGRSLFRIHGDDAEHDASTGCIVVGPEARKSIKDAGGGTLKVVPGSEGAAAQRTDYDRLEGRGNKTKM